jgi:transcriptional regulator with PAS, ATPase and Fis domain
LINTVRPYIEKLYSIVEGSGFYLMLSDKDGYVLDLIGDQNIITAGRESSLLVVGANRSEAYAGTNAIGTCLATRKPIQIWDGEHYVQIHKKYACSCAPILDADGDIMGCLNLTGEYKDIHTHTLGMVLSAVDGISKELQIRRAYDKIELISAQRNNLIESVSSGLILLDQDGVITQINGTALKMLNLTGKRIRGENISNLISFNDPDSDLDFSQFAKPIHNKETNIFLKGSSLPPTKFSMSIDFIEEKNVRSAVVRLDESKQINKLVNKVGGFKAAFTFNNIIGSSPITKELIDNCQRVAQSSSNILILGESGTGKELVAQSIHNNSNFNKGPFVAINCGAIPKGLIESELFGYESGAFTGANKEGHPGKFELADGGTIFLDEIGDMPLDVQVTLLRVLQTKEIVRIGGKYPKKINVRIIAATNKDLTEAIESNTFREDLYYRLNVLTINVPPLRDRGNDVCELADYFISTMNNPKKVKMRISNEVYDLLRNYSWPGNIRELENAMERAINITDSDVIRAEHLPKQVRPEYNANQVEIYPLHEAEAKQDEQSEENLNLKSSSYQLILSSLQKTNGNIQKASELLGISRRTLYRKIDKYDIDYKQYRI